jgi:hypothetical protein
MKTNQHQIETISFAIKKGKIKTTTLIMLMVAIGAGLTDEASAIVYFNDGGYHVIDYTINDFVYVDYEAPGARTHLELVSGGTITYSLRPFNDSQITISGGRIGMYLPALDNVQVVITGGTIDQLLWAEENSHITIYGMFDSYGELPLGSPVWDTVRNVYVPSGHITGTLANGDPINKDYYIWDDATITLVPEPATLLLLGLGAAIATGRR